MVLGRWAPVPLTGGDLARPHSPRPSVWALRVVRCPGLLHTALVTTAVPPCMATAPY